MTLAVSQFRGCILCIPRWKKAPPSHAFISRIDRTKTTYRALPVFVTNHSSRHITQLLSLSNHDIAVNCVFKEIAKNFLFVILMLTFKDVPSN